MEHISKPLERSMEAIMGNQNCNVQPKQQHGEQSRQTDPKRIAQILVDCFLCLNTYGREPEYLETAVRVFSRVLAEYDADKVEAAFTKWMKTSSAMPTPADIVGIIERRGEPRYNETKTNLVKF
jgi:hypothetical protein